MKQERYMTPYPIYPPYQGIPNMPTPYYGIDNNTDTITNLNNRINNLEQRVSNLEDTINQGNTINYSNTKYSSSNYPMM